MTNTSSPKAVILVSGGLDSVTVLAIACEQNYVPYVMTIDYHQHHKQELHSARKVVAHYPQVVEHKILSLDLTHIGGSSLTENSEKYQVPHIHDVKDINTAIPNTYVPARNSIFLSLALAWAETLGAWDIFIGANAVDYSNYPDCRPPYLEAFEKMANAGTAAGVSGVNHFKIQAPLLYMKKADIIKKGIELGVDYSMTLSCYDPTPQGKACGSCHACLLRAEGFKQNLLPDPSLFPEQKIHKKL